MAELKAAVASAAPVGSAPLLVTETEPAGCATGRGDVLEVGEVDRVRRDVRRDRGSRNLVPAGYVVPEQRAALVVEVVRVAARACW